jgi:HEAT repeat protein
MRGALIGVGLLLIALATCSVRGPRSDLLDQLGSEDPLAAVTAGVRIQQMGDAALPLLRHGLSHPDEDVRSRCLRYIAFLKDNGPVEEVVSCLKDPSEKVRLQAAGALRHLRAWKDSSLLLEVLQDQAQPPRVRIDLAEALGRRREPRAVPVLARLLADSRQPPKLRRQAACSLAWMVANEHAGLLGRLACSPGEPPMVRLAAVRALGRLEPGLAAPHLLRLLAARQESAELRGQAAISLGALPYRAAVPVLERLSRDASQPLQLRLRALWGLTRMGLEAPHDLVAGALSHPDRKVRLDAARLAGELRDVDFYGLLEAARAREKDGEVRCALDASLRRLRWEQQALWMPPPDLGE